VLLAQDYGWNPLEMVEILAMGRAGILGGGSRRSRAGAGDGECWLEGALHELIITGVLRAPTDS
jgi:hypothetical protein